MGINFFKAEAIKIPSQEGITIFRQPVGLFRLIGIGRLGCSQQDWIKVSIRIYGLKQASRDLDTGFQKDKKEVIDQIKNDYPKSKDEEGAADVDNKSQMH